jgi:hypothetical protein
MVKLSRAGALAGAFIAVVGLSAGASAEPRHHRRHGAGTVAGHPLTIGGRPRGIYRAGNTIVAPGGFGAYGYGYPVATPEERRQAENDAIRARSGGLYGYGVDGIGGLGYDADGETGYDNPYYGNAFNRYVGYDGVPSQLSFGPAYANRHIAGHDPLDDQIGPGPSPAELGYTQAPDE